MVKEVPIQIIINDKETGVSAKFDFENIEVKRALMGKKIGDIVEGELIGFPNFMFQIRGGSDLAGFPHIKGVPGIALKKILKSGPPGYRPKKIKVEKKTGGYRIINLKNVKKKKSVRGEELSEWTRQVNMVILERKGKPIEELDENAILNDKLLSVIAEKVGKVVLRPGFKILSIGSEQKTTFEEYLRNNGITEETLSKLYRKIGAYVLKLGNRKREVLRHTRYASRRHIDPLSSHIIAVTISLYERFKKGEIDLNSDEFVEKFSEEIFDVINKFLDNRLEKRAKIKLSLPEE